MRIVARSLHIPAWAACGLVASLLAAAACSDSPTGVRPGPPAQLDVVSGNAQEGPVGVALPDPLVVKVLDERGRPVPNQLINFRITAGGGSVFAGSALTNAQGIAQERWTLGTSTSGTQEVEARAVDSNTGDPLLFGTFRAVAKPGPAVALERMSTNVANQVVGSAAAPSPAVRALDQYGNAVPGIAVMFAASAGGTVTGGSGSTGSNGIATVGGWTLATAPGLNTLTATVVGLPPVSFAITGVAGSAAQLTKRSADPQSAVVATSVLARPSVMVLDAHGNPVPGVTVTFEVTSGGGSRTGASQVSDELGIATVGSWTLGTSATTNTLEARAADRTVIFTTTATPGLAATVAKLAGDNQSAEVGQQVPIAPRVRVSDQYGNVIAGAEVTFSIASGGGAVTPAAVVTAPDGSAGATGWTLGTVAGRNTLSVTAGAAPTATFTATALQGQATSLGIVSSPRFAFPGVGLDMVVRMQDAFGNPVAQAGLTVSAAIASGPSGGTLTGSTATTDATGAASFSDMKILGSDGVYAIRFAAAGTNGVTSPGITLMRFTRVSSGNRHTCALDTSGVAYCWGDNSAGQLGNGLIEENRPPHLRAHAVLGDYRFTTLQSGAFHTCGLTSDGRAYCWGSNSTRQLGNTTFRWSPTPVPVAGDLRFIAITLGDFHTCGIAVNGAAYCWGRNLAGQLGDGSIDWEGIATPNPVVGNLTFVSISAGYQHTCAVATDGAAYCWGADYDGALGAPETDVCVAGSTSMPCNRTPKAVTGNLRFTSISSRNETTCALATDGLSHCWGDNYWGEVGDGTRSGGHPSPTLVATGERFVLLSTGENLTCGLTADGSALCWGIRWMENMQYVADVVPTPLAGGHRFRLLELRGLTSCGVTLAGTPLCWGGNGWGQVGDGTTSQVRVSPTAVKPPE